MKLEGFGLFVEDMAVMVRFYRDVLGFAIRESEDATNVYLEKDGTLFLLYRRSDFEAMRGFADILKSLCPLRTMPLWTRPTKK